MMNFDKEFEIPEGLSPKGLAAAEMIRKLAEKNGWSTGGCKTFYSPEEWQSRGESYGAESLLIIVHDGGDIAPRCNLDYMCYDEHDKFQRQFAPLGLFVESCTNWYSAVYEI